MPSIRMVGTGTIENVASEIYNTIVNGSITGEVMLDVSTTFDNGKSRMIVFEKYYYRAGNRASLSVLLTQIEDLVTVDAVSTGGSTGVLIKFNWGAESSFVGLVEKTLRRIGFR